MAYRELPRWENSACLKLIKDVDAYIERTGTSYYTLTRAARMNQHWKWNVLDGKSMLEESCERLLSAMRRNPDGIPRERSTAKPIQGETDEYLQARRDAVARERLERATALLAQEKPGICGRKFSTRPVWEMVA